MPKTTTRDIREIVAALKDIRPATDLLIAHLAEAVAQVGAHDHPKSGGDLYCLNLTSFMGDRMGPVLRRLADEQAENEALRAQLAAAQPAQPSGPCPVCEALGQLCTVHVFRPDAPPVRTV